MNRRLLRRGKPFFLAAAAAAAAYSFFSSPVDHAAPGASGHLGLVRAHPGLSELNALLTREAFLLDSTHALAAGVLRSPPIAGALLRMVRASFSEKIALAESQGNAPLAADHRRLLAVLDAQDGRFDAALDAFARLARESPADHRPPVSAAALCFLVGQDEEGLKWLYAIPKGDRGKERDGFLDMVVRATFGGAPKAVAGHDDLVMYAAFELSDRVLRSMLEDKGLSMAEKLQIRTYRAFLERAMRDNSYRKQGEEAVKIKNALDGSRDASSG